MIIWKSLTDPLPLNRDGVEEARTFPPKMRSLGASPDFLRYQLRQYLLLHHLPTSRLALHVIVTVSPS